MEDKRELEEFFLTFQSCISNLNRVKDVMKEFMRGVLSGEVNFLNYTEVQERVLSASDCVIKNCKQYIKRSKKSMGEFERAQLERELKDFLELFKKCSLPYSTLKERVDNIVRSLNYLKGASNDSIILWQNILDKCERVEKEILPKHGESRHRDNLLEFITRCVVYFIDSLSLDSKNEISLLDHLEDTQKKLSSYGLNDAEIDMYILKLENLILEAQKKLDLISSSYLSFSKDNPYTFYTKERFMKELQVFKSLMNKRIFQTLFVNYSAVLAFILITILLPEWSMENEKVFKYGSIALLGIIDVSMCNNFDKELTILEQKDELLREEFNRYEGLKDQYLKRYSLKKINK